MYKDYTCFQKKYSMGLNSKKENRAERKRIDAVTRAVLGEEKPKTLWDTLRSSVSVPATWGTPTMVQTGAINQVPKIESSLGTELGIGAAGLLGPTLGGVAAEGAAFGPLYANAAKKLAVDIPAFEVLDRLPELWGAGRMTEGIGNDVERGVRYVMPDGRAEDIAAPALGTIARFASGVPLGGVADLMANNAGNVMRAASEGIGLNGYLGNFSGDWLEVPSGYDDAMILQREQDLLRGTREEARANWNNRLADYRRRLQTVQENLSGMPTRNAVIDDALGRIRVPFYDSRAANAGLAPNDPDFVNVFRERAIAQREANAVRDNIQRARRRIAAEARGAARGADVAEQALEFSDIPTPDEMMANHLRGFTRQNNVPSVPPVRELSDAEFISGATPRRLRLLSSTPSRVERTRIVNNVMSDVFGSDWRTNPNAFTDINSRLGPTGPVQGLSETGNVFTGRYGISPSEFERLVGSSPNGRQRDLHELMQTARNLETEAGGLENLRTMLAEGRLPNDRGTFGGVRLPSGNAAPTINTQNVIDLTGRLNNTPLTNPVSSTATNGISSIPGNNEFIEDMFRQNWGIGVDEGIAFLRNQGHTINRMGDVSDAFRDLESSLGSRTAVRNLISSTMANQGSSAQSSGLDLLKKAIHMPRYDVVVPETGGRGQMRPFFISHRRPNPEEFASMKRAIPSLSDDELFNAYMGKVYDAVKVTPNRGMPYERDYVASIENDSMFRDLAREMQKRFGSTQGSIPGYEGETFHFGSLAGTEYDKLARWVRFAEDSPYVKNAYQYSLPGDAEHFSWFNDYAGNLNGLGKNAGQAALDYQRSVPAGSAVTERYTSVESEPLKASGALTNYGHDKGQSYVEILRDEQGKPILEQRNHYGHSNRVNMDTLSKDLEEKLEAYRKSVDDVAKARAKKIAEGKNPNDVLDPVMDPSIKAFLEHIDNGSVNWVNELNAYLTQGRSDYEGLFNDFIRSRIAKSRANVIRKVGKPIERAAAIEGWTDIPKPFYNSSERDILNDLLEEIKQGRPYFEYNPQPYSVAHHVIQHDLGGPLLPNHYDRGGDKKDLTTVRRRRDFNVGPITKFIQDVIGPKFYPNPVGIHGDFSRFYFGRPTENDTFYMSSYTPSKSKGNSSTYYGVKDIRFLNNLVELYNAENTKLTESGQNHNLSGYKARDPSITANNKGLVSELPDKYDRRTDEYMLGEGVSALGNFTVGRGSDDKGDYLSYYDLWDTEPRFSHEVERRGIAKPYEVYDRIYGYFEEDGTFHPNGELPAAIVYGDSLACGGLLLHPYAGGGPYMKLIDRVNNTSNAEFVSRLKDPNRKYITNGDGTISTHLLGYADDGNTAVVFPSIQNISDSLVTFPDWRSAYDSAVSRGDTLQMSIPEAEWFTKNYKDFYPKFDYADGGPLKSGNMLRQIIVTPDKEYNYFLDSLPDNQRLTSEGDYSTKRYWELNGKPKDFDEAKKLGMYTYDSSDNSYHANTIAWGDDGIGYFMKPKHHDTVKYELDWFNNGIVTEEGGRQHKASGDDLKEWEEFRKNYDIDTTGNFYKYIPKQSYSSGGKIHIKPSKRGTFTAAAKQHGKSVQAFASQVLAHKENYSPAMVKKANFARNAAKWHDEGGPLDAGIDYSGIATTNHRKYNQDYISYIDSSLANANLAPAQRASILANIIEESGGNPFALDSTGKFYGLMQWADDRYQATGEQDPYREIDNQVNHILNTLGNTTDGKSWTHGGTGSGYNSYKDAMTDFDSDDLATAMKGFTLGYVRPTGKMASYNNRLKVAEQLLERYNNIPERKVATVLEKLKSAFGNDTEAMRRLVNAAKGGFR